MTRFSEKMFISTRCIHGFMSSFIKRSWTDSTRDFFCCNPSKKDSLDKIKTSQSIWKEFLKTISQPTHQSKMQVAIFISKKSHWALFPEVIFFYSGKNLKWQKNPFLSLKFVWHTWYGNTFTIKTTSENVYLLVVVSKWQKK